jgi:hypothetical protein
MDSITVNWIGPYSLNQTTPRELQRKMGVYAVLHGSSCLFFGKAKRGKGIFREAKLNREEEYWNGLKILGIVNGDMPAHYKLVDEVYNNCKLYAGVVSKEKIGLVDDLEKLFVFKLKPVCNDKYVKNLESRKELHISHTGNPPKGLEWSISTLE